MRRIYESNAVSRDDENPFQPNQRDARVEPRAMRSVPGATLSGLIIPHWLRHRSIRLDLSTPRDVYATGTPVPFTVTMRNAMPFPISIGTDSPLFWNWYVDGHPEADLVSDVDPPEEGSSFSFGRGERKRFSRRWNQMFRTSSREWTPAKPGEYTISARLNVDDAMGKGLHAETTVRLVATD